MRRSRVRATTVHPNGAAAAIRRGMEEPGRLKAEEWPPTARGRGAPNRPPGAVRAAARGGGDLYQPLKHGGV